MGVVALEKTRCGLSCVKLENINDFDVEKIFDCGQCFRFDRVESSPHEVEFSGVAFGRLISVAQDGKDVYIYNATARDLDLIWRDFLALDEDYEAITKDISSRSSNPALHRAIEYGRGIRILRQEPWEAICSFIISQNNNIPRIKKIISSLSERCGEPIEVPPEMRSHLSCATAPYSFPTPASLAELGIDGLSELRVGFRAKYIYDAATRAERGEIDYDLLSCADDTEAAIRHLCEIKGVGPKVASCALLFGFARYDAFPVDVWIKKVIEKYFSREGERISDFSPSSLGKYAGIAQQYLFYYERWGGNDDNNG